MSLLTSADRLRTRLHPLPPTRYVRQCGSAAANSLTRCSDSLVTLAMTDEMIDEMIDVVAVTLPRLVVHRPPLLRARTARGRRASLRAHRGARCPWSPPNLRLPRPPRPPSTAALWAGDATSPSPRARATAPKVCTADVHAVLSNMFPQIVEQARPHGTRSCLGMTVWSGRAHCSRAAVHSRSHRELFEEHLSGINFDKYDDIPVDVSGNEPPAAISLFADLKLGEVLTNNLALCNYSKPTPVQKNAIPIILSSRDLMACAQTGLSLCVLCCVVFSLHCLWSFAPAE